MLTDAERLERVSKLLDRWIEKRMKETAGQTDYYGDDPKCRLDVFWIRELHDALHGTASGRTTNDDQQG